MQARGPARVDRLRPGCQACRNGRNVHSFGMRVLRWIVPVLLLLPTIGRADQADEVARIHTEAIGGRQRMDLMRTLRATGRVEIDGRVMTFALLAERPNRLRMETRTEGRRSVQATNGVDAPWQLLADGQAPRVTQLQDFAAREFAADAEFDDPLVNYAARGYALDYAGTTQVGDRPAIRLLVTRRFVDSFELLIDAETYFILKRITRQVRQGREITTEILFDDHRPVGGVIIPHRFLKYADGRLLYESRFETVEVNVPVPPDSFNPPILVNVPPEGGTTESGKILEATK